MRFGEQSRPRHLDTDLSIRECVHFSGAGEGSTHAGLHRMVSARFLTEHGTLHHHHPLLVGVSTHLHNRDLPDETVEKLF